MTADPRDRRHEAWLERQIRALIGDGDVSHLPNAGRCIDWSKENPHTPDDLRIAYRIMQDAGVLPGWMERGAELERLAEQIEGQAQRFWGDFAARRAEGERRGSLLLLREAETRWQSA